MIKFNLGYAKQRSLEKSLSGAWIVLSGVLTVKPVCVEILLVSSATNPKYNFWYV